MIPFSLRPRRVDRATLVLLSSVFMLPPAIGGGGVMFSGCLSGCPSVSCPFVRTYFASRDISVRGGEISMKLGTNIHHGVAIAEKVFKVRGQRSRSRLEVRGEIIRTVLCCIVY